MEKCERATEYVRAICERAEQMQEQAREARANGRQQRANELFTLAAGLLIAPKIIVDCHTVRRPDERERIGLPPVVHSDEWIEAHSDPLSSAFAPRDYGRY